MPCNNFVLRAAQAWRNCTAIAAVTHAIGTARRPCGSWRMRPACQTNNDGWSAVVSRGRRSSGRTCRNPMLITVLQTQCRTSADKQISEGLMSRTFGTRYSANACRVRTAQGRGDEQQLLPGSAPHSRGENPASAPPAQGLLQRGGYPTVTQLYAFASLLCAAPATTSDSNSQRSVRCCRAIASAGRRTLFRIPEPSTSSLSAQPSPSGDGRKCVRG